MATTNPYQSYKQNSVNTASPGELTLMLYNGCLKFIGLAKNAIQNNDIATRNVNIQKAQKIINELMVTLNMDFPISKNFMSLYDFMNRQLIKANIVNDIKILEDVEFLLTEFRDTWKEAIQINRQKQYAAGGQA
ncbi:flagellar export chaperone FliS [Niallia taxi]|uniref:Flagellar secretion chaperone FliS n=1 Tax=Niallia taxi TaxID=2499688 RepID=A0A3S2TXP8_9BACI|nr:flagellar export chaperone FliS [Niallia taxi]MCM3216278.1 flagellar export chaperone FliS [Niallia taxi]MCT2347442.1 flagellar export chaperone FliS [Niallia taxi]MDE5054783.1 flagellar export chaperone FliS [Niallia taxi]MDK8640331.1 flagellar export chaperone FliS [Niallia taxi]MED3963921.1 flagellar export chaperone FliS [Niallia taxi]